MTLKSPIAAVVVLVASLAGTRFSVADELLRIDGRAVKWAAPALGLTTVITFATVTQPFSLPGTKKTISPDNCGSMGVFDEIVAVSAELPASTAREELRAAFASWEKVAGVKFVEIDEVRHANIVVGAIFTSKGPAFANLSLEGTLVKQSMAETLGISIGNIGAEADNPTDVKSAAAIEQAYICLNPKHPWKIGFDGDLNVYDLRHAFMHEIGHAIGLDHPGSSGAIMGYRYDEQARELQPSDIAAAQLLYGPPRATNDLRAPGWEP